MNIILMGMKHCGKSTVGRRLASDLGLTFYDLDELILKRCGPDCGGPGIEDLFRERGAEEFYALEAEAYGAVCASPQAERGFVLATGGRTPFNPRLERALEQCGILIYINTPIATIVERIKAGGTSTLLQGADPESSLRALYNERHPGYLTRARLVVDGGGDAAAVAGRIKQALKELQRGG